MRQFDIFRKTPEELQTEIDTIDENEVKQAESKAGIQAILNGYKE